MSAMVTGSDSWANFASVCSSINSTSWEVSVEGSFLTERILRHDSFQPCAGRDHGRRGYISHATLPGCYEMDYSACEKWWQPWKNLAAVGRPDFSCCRRIYSCERKIFTRRFGSFPR